MGLVEILPEHPKRYKALPFTTFLDRERQRHEDNLSLLDTEEAALADAFRVTGTGHALDEGRFTVVRSRDRVRDKMEQLLGEASQEVLILATRGMVGLLLKSPEALEAARARGARIRVLVPAHVTSSPEGAVDLGDLHRFAALRVRRMPKPRAEPALSIATFDGRDVFLVSFVPDDAGSSGRDVGLASDQVGLVQGHEALLAHLWDGAAAVTPAVRSESMAPPLRRILTTQAAVHEAMRRAVASGVHTLRYVNGFAHAPSDPLSVPIARELLDQGVAVQAILDLSEPEAAEAWHGLSGDAEGFSLHHVARAPSLRLLVIDDREIFCSTQRPIPFADDAAEDPSRGPYRFMHVRDASVAHAYNAEFEALQSRATPISATHGRSRDRSITLPVDTGS